MLDDGTTELLMDIRANSRGAILAWAILIVLLLGPAGTAAQEEGGYWFTGPLDELSLVPFGGTPVIRGMGIPVAFGIHALWPARSRASLVTRYEIRATRKGDLYDVGTLDVMHRLAGSDTSAVAITGGWARWARDDYGTLGLRVTRALVPPETEGSPSVQGWFDARLAFPGVRSLAALDGILWVQVMVSYVLPVRFAF